MSLCINEFSEEQSPKKSNNYHLVNFDTNLLNKN